MAHLKKHRETLLVLTKARPKLVQEIISTADKSLIHALSECALNILTGIVPLTPAKKKEIGEIQRQSETFGQETHIAQS